jgi:hypothetical protein
VRNRRLKSACARNATPRPGLYVGIFFADKDGKSRMSTYVCILLDPECKVLLALVLRADCDGTATTEALSRVHKLRAWGYELWRNGRRVTAYYDCKHPPARISA